MANNFALEVVAKRFKTIIQKNGFECRVERKKKGGGSLSVR